MTPNSMRRRRTSAQISSSAFGVAAFKRVEKRRRYIVGRDRQVVRKYQPRFPVEAEGHHASDRRRTARQYLHRVDSPVRHGARLSRDAGARCHRRFLARNDARCSRAERPYLRPLHADKRRGDLGFAEGSSSEENVQ